MTHKAKKGPISWPHSGSKGKTMAPTGLRNKARGYLTIINISFLQDPAQRMEGELGGVIEEKEMDGQTCFI